MLTLKLTLTVTYDEHGASKRELIDNLESLVTEGIGNGRLTGEGDAEVTTHECSVEEV